MAVGISGEKKLGGSQFKNSSNLGKGKVQSKMKATLPTANETMKETVNQAIARRKKQMQAQQGM